MTPKSKSFVARVVLGAVALAGAAAAVPANAHPYWGHERGWVARGYAPAYYDGYRPEIREIDRWAGPAYYEGYRPHFHHVREYGPRVIYYGHRW